MYAVDLKPEQEEHRTLNETRNRRNFEKTKLVRGAEEVNKQDRFLPLY
jgi:hypothetical protein